MSRLTAAARNRLPASDFAGPDRSYPIEDQGHATAALGRVQEFGSPALQKKVRAKVSREFPAKSLGGQLAAMRSAGQFKKAAA